MFLLSDMGRRWSDNMENHRNQTAKIQAEIAALQPMPQNGATRRPAFSVGRFHHQIGHRLDGIPLLAARTTPVQGFEDESAVAAAVARGAVEHLRADAVQSAQIGVLRAFATSQLDFDQPAQSQKSRIVPQFALEKLQGGLLALLSEQPLGQGIRDAATAQAIGKVADAVVIGSRIIQLIEDQEHAKVVPITIDFLRGVRKALDA